MISKEQRVIVKLLNEHTFVVFSICEASKERLRYSFSKITMVEEFDSKGGKC